MPTENVFMQNPQMEQNSFLNMIQTAMKFTLSPVTDENEEPFTNIIQMEK